MNLVSRYAQSLTGQFDMRKEILKQHFYHFSAPPSSKHQMLLQKNSRVLEMCSCRLVSRLFETYPGFDFISDTMSTTETLKT